MFNLIADYFGLNNVSNKLFWYIILQSLFCGANDIIIVKSTDGKLRSSPFQVHFGGINIEKSNENTIEIFVNGYKKNVTMKLGKSGDAYFDFDFEDEEMMKLSEVKINAIKYKNGEGEGGNIGSENTVKSSKNTRDDNDKDKDNDDDIINNDNDELDGDIIISSDEKDPIKDNSTKTKSDEYKSVNINNTLNCIQNKFNNISSENSNNINNNLNNLFTLNEIMAGETSLESYRKSYKSLHPSQTQLKRLLLKEGKNEMIFVYKTDSINKKSVKCRAFLWENTEKIVISDIDGTITRSDVLGMILPFFGKSWNHKGVTKLYENIHKNGYKFIYMTSRPIAQDKYTGNYLESLKESRNSLPEGPLLMSPDGIFTSLKREVIDKTDDNSEDSSERIRLEEEKIRMKEKERLEKLRKEKEEKERLEREKIERERERKEREEREKRENEEKDNSEKKNSNWRQNVRKTW